jgi:hypothetical protein
VGRPRVVRAWLAWLPFLLDQEAFAGIRLVEPDGTAVAMVFTDADIHVEAGVVVAVLTSGFRNTGPDWVDARYVHPLPVGARVEAVEIRVEGHASGDGLPDETGGAEVRDIPPGGEVEVRTEIVLGPEFSAGEYRLDMELAGPTEETWDRDSEVHVTLHEGVPVHGLWSGTHPLQIRSLWTDSPHAEAAGPPRDRVAVTWTMAQDVPVARVLETPTGALWVAVEPARNGGCWEALSVEVPGPRAWEVGARPDGPLRLLLPRGSTRIVGRLGGKPFTIDVPRPIGKLLILPPIQHLSLASVRSVARDETGRGSPSAPGLPVPPASAAVKNGMHTNRRNLAYCFDRARRTQPDLEGRLELDLVIVRGEVTWTEVTYDATGSSSLASCVETTMRRLEFPPEVSMFVRVPYTLGGP